MIVSIDGCFSQKQWKGKGDCDRTLEWPTTIFIHPEMLQAMKSWTEQDCPPRRSKPHHAQQSLGVSSKADEDGNVDETREPELRDWVDDDAATEDVVECGMEVLASALDACHQSFMAADEAWQKASTTIFSDTGLMSLMCCHDWATYLCNMQTLGEAQYYALTLLNELFKGLPPSARVGVLYDIGCQLHQSIVKVCFNV